ncbi:MAG: flagellar hook capping FlgD N-terminal domain-containing protein [Solirubrobacterales bacterium]
MNNNTSPYTSYTTTSTQQKSTSSSSSTLNEKGALGKDDFLKLLVAELKYQDPLEPMKDREFIAQMSSFSSLEQMQNLNTGFSALASTLKESIVQSGAMQQAVVLIGMQVNYKSGDQSLTGVVDSVKMESGVPSLMIGGKKVSVSDITEIRIPAVSNVSTEGA